MIEPDQFIKLLASLVKANPDYTEAEIGKLMVDIGRSEFVDGMIIFPNGERLKETE